MARCPDCNKFVSLELGDSPDVSLDIDAEGTITGEATIMRNCAECGTELQEGRFDVNVTIAEVVAHADLHADARAEKEKARAEAEKAAAEAGTELPDEDPDDVDFNAELTIEDEEAEAVEGGTSRKPTFGVHGTFVVKCSCGEFEHTGEFSDEMTSAEMEELS